jgi:hypothetical protein
MKSNTMLVIGDIHIKRKDLQRSKLILDGISDVMHYYQPSLGTVLLGDVFNDHDKAFVECLDLYSDFLEKTSSLEKIHILGNHEMVNSVEPLTPANVLRPYYQSLPAVDYYGERPITTYITRPRQIFYKELNGCLGFMPYVPPKTVFWNEVRKFKEENLILFCHQEFKGAIFGAGKQSEIGDEFEMDTPIISGHIHRNHTIESVWYPGTPAQSDFGEAEDKAVFLIEVLPKEKNRYRILEKIVLPNVPKFRTVAIPVSEAANFLSDLSDDKFRFSIEGSKSELTAFRATEQCAHLSKMGKIKFVLTKRESEAKVSTAKSRNYQEILKEYAIKENLLDVYSSVFN